MLITTVFLWIAISFTVLYVCLREYARLRNRSFYPVAEYAEGWFFISWLVFGAFWGIFGL